MTNDLQLGATEAGTIVASNLELRVENERLRKWLERISIQVGGLRKNLKAEAMANMAKAALRGETL